MNELRVEVTHPGGNTLRDELIAKFAAQMRIELDAPINAAKGDDWKEAPLEEQLHEIMYHFVKLRWAIHEKDLAGIREFAADTANHLAMLADTFGVLDNPDYAEGEYVGHDQRVTADRMLDAFEWTGDLSL